MPTFKYQKGLKDYVKEICKSENMDYIAMWGSIFCLEAVGVTDYFNILKLAKLCFTFAVANAKSETGFSYIKRVENSLKGAAWQRTIIFLRKNRNRWKATCRAVEGFL